MGGYNTSKDSISCYLGHVSKAIVANMSIYENFILIGDFNAISYDYSMCIILKISLMSPHIIRIPTAHNLLMLSSQIEKNVFTTPLQLKQAFQLTTK